MMWQTCYVSQQCQKYLDNLSINMNFMAYMPHVKMKSSSFSVCTKEHNHLNFCLAILFLYMLTEGSHCTRTSLRYGK